MSALREAAQQALEALNSIDVGYRSPNGSALEVSFDEAKCEAAITALRAALAQVAGLREKVGLAYGYLWCVNNEPGAPHQMPPERMAYEARKLLRDTMTHHERGEFINRVVPLVRGVSAELTSAALGQEQAEPEGSVCARCGALAFDPVVPQAEPLNLLDRAVQRRLAAQWGYVPAEQVEPAQPVAWMHPHKPDQICLSPQDGWLSLVIAQPKAEPVTWVASEDGCVIYDDISMDDVVLRVSGDFETDEQRINYAKQIADKLSAPPRRTMVPLTEEEILAAVGWERAEMYMKLTPNFPVDEAKKETLKNARAVEKASWEKNHGQA